MALPNSDNNSYGVDFRTPAASRSIAHLSADWYARNGQC